MEHELLTVQNVKDLRDGGKRWLENLLGQNLRDNQQVFIMVFTPDVEPDETARRQARAGLERALQKTEQYADMHGITENEVDAAVDEAMRHIRPGSDA